jgi:copper(I)-binding protein
MFALHDAWVRPLPKMEGAGAVYVVIENRGKEADWLTGADSPAAANVEIHESYMDGDVMRMRPVPSLEIPANGSVELKPGGYHVMLIDLQEPLETGDVISVTLHFEQSSDITLDVSIQESE